MPNRIIKDSICRSEDIASLSWFEEVFFYRLLVNCDDYGRFDGRAKIIRGALFPLADVTDKQIANALKKLSSAGLVEVYEVDAKPILQMVTWERHQNIRAKRSKYPPRNVDNLQGYAQEHNGIHMNTDEFICSRNPIQSESKEEIAMRTYTREEILRDPRGYYAWAKKRRAEVSAYVANHSLTVDPDEFCDYMDNHEWLDAGGNPIRDWQAVLCSWQELRGGTA